MRLDLAALPIDSFTVMSCSSSDSSAQSSTDGEEEPGLPWQAQATTSWVRQLPRRFPSRGHVLRLLLPCAGFDAPGIALEALGVPFTVVGAYDTEIGPGRVLRARYGEGAVHIGKAGDICSVDVPPDADGLVSGPPCPPWSCAGSRNGWSDVRARPLRQVVRWIDHLANHGSLKFFVLENVQGMAEKGDGTNSPLTALLADLRKILPDSWRVQVLHLSSECLAQKRPRIYVVGHIVVNPEMNVGSFMPVLHTARLADILLKLPNTDIRTAHIVPLRVAECLLHCPPREGDEHPEGVMSRHVHQFFGVTFALTTICFQPPPAYFAQQPSRHSWAQCIAVLQNSWAETALNFQIFSPPFRAFIRKRN
jgi:hypothetical protein